MKLKQHCEKALLERKVTPAFCGTAFKNKGVQLMLDAVVDYLPSPLDVPPVEGKLKVYDEALRFVKQIQKSRFMRLVFKIMTDPFVGVLSFIRVYSGELKAGSYVYNARTGVKRACKSFS